MDVTTEKEADEEIIIGSTSSVPSDSGKKDSVSFKARSTLTNRIFFWLLKSWKYIRKKIPNEFFSWKRHLIFALLITSLMLLFRFLKEKFVTCTRDVGSCDNIEVHWTSMIPPIFSVGFSACYGQVLFSLGMGVIIGGFIAFSTDVVKAFDKLLLKAILDVDHAYTLGFTLVLIGAVYVMQRSGGLDGFCKVLTKFARSPRGTRIAAVVAGLLFFFDDYGNSVVIGTTFQVLTDKMQISREKLAYICDSTASPVAGLIPISTWIGPELNAINNGLKVSQVEDKGFNFFLKTLAYRFYSVCTLFLLCFSSIFEKDFGPMLKAEVRALREGKVVADDANIKNIGSASEYIKADPNKPQRWYYAAIPIVSLLLFALLGFFYDNKMKIEKVTNFNIFNKEAWTIAMANADSGRVLLFCSLGITGLAVLLPLYGNVIGFDDALRAFLYAIPSMRESVYLLILSWALQNTCSELKTSYYLSFFIKGINIRYIPAISFLLAYLSSFCTGSSWATMLILMPITLPLAYAGISTSKDPNMEFIAYMTGAAVFDGAIFGDHCSPLSDTTLISSICSGCDLIAHTKTQLPYALVAGLIAILLGYIPVANGMHAGFYYLIAFALTFLLIIIFGASLPAPVDVENKSNASYSAVRVLSPFERTLRHVIQKVKR
ncbi:uncharacterized protein HI_1586-like isoform X2 [Zophobas morio]|uniref:uncharacterized protein HI_1586-like isoform X2 n=1 Tax=Zophobas morio TaxID=2755281 RepID=UPI0030839761